MAGSLAQTGSDIDEAAVAFFAWKNDAVSANEFFWSSENPTTAAAKRAYWHAQGAGGLFLWQLAGDDTAFPILALCNSLHGSRMGSHGHRADRPHLPPCSY